MFYNLKRRRFFFFLYCNSILYVLFIDFNFYFLYVKWVYLKEIDFGCVIGKNLYFCLKFVF